MNACPEKILFLPGASGNAQFWGPVADALKAPIAVELMGWPGFGQTPIDPTVHSVEDLSALAFEKIDRPTALVAQSMGGVVAVIMALARPELITHLILTVTSGGVNLDDLGAEDWRTEFAKDNPHLPRWFLDDRTDLSDRMHELHMPVLLLWGDEDPISPIKVGERLKQLIPSAKLEVFPGADHDLGFTHAGAIAKLIDVHLGFSDRV